MSTDGNNILPNRGASVNARLSGPAVALSWDERQLVQEALEFYASYSSSHALRYRRRGRSDLAALYTFDLSRLKNLAQRFRTVV